MKSLVTTMKCRESTLRCGVRAAAATVVAVLTASQADAQSGRAGGFRMEEVAPSFYVLTQGSDNLVVYTGQGASLVVGVQKPVLADSARTLVRRLRAAPVRWAVAMENEFAPGYGDGGWERLGTQTVAHEMLHVRMERLARAQADSGRASASRLTLPGASFSAVVQLYLGPEEVHLVHPRAGYTDADVIAHWEEAGVVYLGNTFTNDGYPMIDYSRRGSLSGMIATVEFFVTTFAQRPQKLEPIIPGRGPIATLADLRAYHEMLITVRDRLTPLVAAGKEVAEVVAAKPTADLDARWGRGPVSPDQFVSTVYSAMVRARCTATRANPNSAGSTATTPARSGAGAPSLPPSGSGHTHSPATPGAHD